MRTSEIRICRNQRSVDFDYLDPTGHKQKLHYYFSKSSSDYLSAPADAINYIREILVSVGVLREAA